jgi:transposase
VAYNFLAENRDQLYLLPVPAAEWLPEDHLAYFVLDAVAEMDLSAFYAGYRDDGWGGAARHPKTMVALLLYAYCLGVRSSRRIERACLVDVAFGVICANVGPDHTTIARFRQRHEQALKTLFTASLRLCAREGSFIRFPGGVGGGSRVSASVAATSAAESTRAVTSQTASMGLPRRLAAAPTGA